MLRDYLRQVRKHTDYGRIFIAWIIASAITAAMFWFIRESNPFFSIIAAAAVFALMYGVLLVLFRESFMISMLHKDRR